MRIEKIDEIPLIFENRFPPYYINDVEGWGVSRDDLHSRSEDGTFKLLTLDIDFGQKCTLACPHCFRKSNALDTEAPPLSFDELLSYIKEAKGLGLKSVKFLGAGEPFEQPRIIEFLKELRKLDIKPAIFTKGHVLGSDSLTREYFSPYGIETAERLVRMLKELDVSILLGFNSFDEETQTNFIGKKASNGKGYFKLRNNALVNLVNAGFNEYVPGKATRLALIAAPIKPENIDEIFEIYRWGRRRNMYTLSCPTTFSGRGKCELDREHLMDFESYIYNLKDLYVKIYKWNIENGLMSLETFMEEGVSLYPGCHTCNQVAAGMYLTLRGKIIRCPGRDDNESEIVEDIRKEKSLKDVWRKSFNYKLARRIDKFNFHCIARDGYFFERKHNFYQDVYLRVLNGVNAKKKICTEELVEAKGEFICPHKEFFSNNPNFRYVNNNLYLENHSRTCLQKSL